MGFRPTSPLLGFLILSGLLLAQSSATHAQGVVRTAPELHALWLKLDAGRGYRLGFGEGRCDNDPTKPCTANANCTVGQSTGKCQRYAPAIKNWSTAVPGYEPQKPGDIFIELAGPNGFPKYLSQYPDEATAGTQESLNELMAGQSLIGNELLVEGLRTRFPSNSDQPDPSQLMLLKASSTTFRQGIEGTIDELRTKPDSLRASGTVNSDFPFFVENAHDPGLTGEVVENEYYRFTDLVQQDALAENSIGQREFFFGNTDAVGRGTAALALKRSAQATYLNTALLSALETEREFQNNNGHELKREILDAERVFDDILAGLNPLQLRGDFVPRQPVEHFLETFDTLVGEAQHQESDATLIARTYDVDQTALQTELANEQGKFLNDIETLTGISATTIPKTYNNLATVDDRNNLFGDANINVTVDGNPGSMHAKLLDIEGADLDANTAAENLRQIPEMIRIEQDRNAQVAEITTATGNQIAALDLATGFANALGSICTCGLGSGVQFNLAAIPDAEFRSEQTLLTTLQNVTIGNIDSAATIQDLLLKEAIDFIAVERANNIIQQKKAELAELQAQLQRDVRDYVSAQANLASSYYLNPGYRLQLDVARDKADQSFQAAMVQGYFAAKALEYEWAERYENPVERTDHGLAEPVGDATKFGQIVRAESVFASRSAGSSGSPSPTLEDFREALRLWDQKVRQIRGHKNQPAATTTLSLRKDVLRYVGGDERQNSLLFANFVAAHRQAGAGTKQNVVLPFSISIADQLLLPAEPNLKIVSLSLNLKSRPPRLAAETGPTGWNGNPFNVQLVFLNDAVLRTFFAVYPANDLLLTIDLGGAPGEDGGNLRTSPFGALVQTSLDGFTSTPIKQNFELADLSPAVSRIFLVIDMSDGTNRHLIPEYLDDIEIVLTYTFGQPADIQF